MNGIWQKIKAFLRWWITPRGSVGPKGGTPDRSWLTIPAVIGIAALDWLYFGVFVPFQTIANVTVFLLALIAWGLPTVLVIWLYRNAPEAKLRNVTGNFFVIVGVTGIVVYALWSRFEFVSSIGLAIMPAVLTGAAIGASSVYASKRQKHDPNQ